MGATELKSILYTLLVVLAFACGLFVGSQRRSIAAPGGVIASLAGHAVVFRPSPPDVAAGPAASSSGQGVRAAPEPAASSLGQGEPAASSPPPQGPAAASEPQWCSQRGSEEEIFECCFKEREGYKDLLDERGVHVRGKTEAYGFWGSAAHDEIKLLFEMLRETEKSAVPGRPFTVCETGFNWGGTSHIFLCASRTNATVLSFDIEKARSAVPNKALTERYGSRLKLTIGDSKAILAKLAKSAARPDCNFVYVDGGHSKDVAKADMINFAKMSRPGTPVVADDCYAEGSLKPGGPKQAFNDMIGAKVIEPQPSVRFKDLTNRMVCMGHYLGPPAA